jgi:O-antigen ligase
LIRVAQRNLASPTVASDVRKILSLAAFGGLWLFAAVACLSIAAQNVLFLGYAAWLALIILERRKPVFPKPLGSWDLFLLWTLLASILSDNASHSLFTWKKWLLAFIVIYVSGAIESKRALRALLGSLLFFSALTFLGATLWALRGPFQSGLGWNEILAVWAERGDWRAVSGSGGYMVLGSCSMLVLVFFGALWIKDRSWRSPLVVLCLGSAAVTLLLTQTRSAWLGALIGALALLWFWRKSVALGLLGLGILSVLILPQNPLLERMSQGLDMRQDSTRERVYMAEAGISIIKAHPWLGVGDALESFDGHPGYYLLNMPEEAKQWASLKDRDEGHLHDDFLQVAVMYGLPALVLLLIFFARLGLAAARSETALGVAMAASLLAWFVNGLFEYNFGSFQSSFFLWFLIGLYLAGARLNESPSY